MGTVNKRVNRITVGVVLITQMDQFVIFAMRVFNILNGKLVLQYSLISH